MIDTNLRSAIIAAAELRSRGANWRSISENLQRSAETCRQWPRRYPDIWNGRVPNDSVTPAPNNPRTIAGPAKTASDLPVPTKRSNPTDPLLHEVLRDLAEHPAVYEAEIARLTVAWKARGFPGPLPEPLVRLAVRDLYTKRHMPKPAPVQPDTPRTSPSTVVPSQPMIRAEPRTNRLIIVVVVQCLLVVGLIGFQLGNRPGQPSTIHVHYSNRADDSPSADRPYNSRIRPTEQTDMRVAHFDCFSGISGDMTLAALVDAGVDASVIQAGIESLGLPIQMEFEKVKRNGFAATYANIQAPEEETHRFLPDVEAIINKGNLSAKQRDLALAIFRRLAVAEATVHGHEVEKVHFHEVGALDSIADIIGAAIGLNLLGVEKFTSRSVPPGSGTVKCAHGIMPIPTPATAELLKGVPLATAPVKAELVTPTGAAILTTVVSEYTDQPAMTIERIGCGAGKRDFWEQPNILRLFVGTAALGLADTDAVTILETNLDDVSPEIIGYCFEQLFAAGALDVYSVPIQMKKNRPGVLLSVIAEASKVAALESILFRETGTFGIRKSLMQRSKLMREAVTVETPWGTVKAKKGWRDGLVVITPEYEDCARIAREKGVALREIYKAVQSCH